MEVKEPKAHYLAAPFKTTEVGEVPADWDVKQLGELCSIRAGGDVDRSLLSPHEDQSYPYPIWANAKSPIPYAYSSIHEYPGESLTVTARGDIGHAVYRDRPYCAVGRLLSLVPTTGVSSRFLAEFINARVTFASESTGVPQLTGPQIAGYSIALPPSAKETHRIGDVLASADALIDSLEQLLTKKRQIKQGAMQELLTGKRRLPGFSGEWESAELRQLGHCIRGVSYNPATDLSEGDNEQTVRLLRSNNVQSNEIVRSGLQYVDHRRVRAEQYLQPGDLLLCMANGSRDLVGKAGRFVAVDEHRYTFGAFMGCFRPNTSAVDPDLVSFHLQTHAFRQHIDLLLAGSSINNLRPEGVLSFSIRVPLDEVEQRAISKVLNDCNEEISRLESRLTKSRALKHAMSQALLIGRIRLVEPTA